MPQIVPLEYLAEKKLAVELALDERLPSADLEPRHVHSAMRYAVLGGGKRLRPIIAMAVAEAGGVDGERVLDAACAIEFVHTASLILDDLPSMDNAMSRRDRPCTHAVHGEATAILASLGLIASSFELVTRNAETMLSKEGVAQAVRDLAETIGTQGLIQGQHVDLTLDGGVADLDDVEHIYRQKAAALFLAAVIIPARLVSLGEPETRALRKFALDLGVAFQITDDLIDARPDIDNGQKTTFATFLGEAGARKKAFQLIEEAIVALDVLGERAVPLRTLAEYVSKRTF